MKLQPGQIRGPRLVRHPVWNRFSPDSTQVIFGMGWYNTDGATALIFDIASDNLSTLSANQDPGLHKYW